MKKTILKVLSYVLVALIAAGTTFGCCLLFVPNFKPFPTGEQKLDMTDTYAKLDEISQIINAYYVGDVDEKKIMDSVAAALIDGLGDYWSYYMSNDQHLDYQDTMSNSYVGIGVTVRGNAELGGLEVISTVPDGPADEAGILAGDIMIAIGGASISDMTVETAKDLIRGEVGTKVSITVKRGEQDHTFSVERRYFETPVATYQMLDGNIGLITIKNFDARCASETIAAVEALRNAGAKALIFDVRNNPGGYQKELVQVLDHLLPEGVLFRSEDHTGKQTLDYSDASCVDLPMAVLTNLNSYSAAEFFAAALSEYDAAVVVGEKTYGKGHFQRTYTLKDGSAICLSVGKYFTPKGNSLAGVGLTPDVEVIVDEQTAAMIYAGTLKPMEDPQILAAINALNSAN